MRSVQEREGIACHAAWEPMRLVDRLAFVRAFVACWNRVATWVRLNPLLTSKRGTNFGRSSYLPEGRQRP
jgi:hypothetical protein